MIASIYETPRGNTLYQSSREQQLEFLQSVGKNLLNDKMPTKEQETTLISIYTDLVNARCDIKGYSYYQYHALIFTKEVLMISRKKLIIDNLISWVSTSPLMNFVALVSAVLIGYKIATIQYDMPSKELQTECQIQR